MTANGWIQIGLFCLAIIVCVKPLGLYMARLFEGERTFLSPVLGPVERGIYRLCGVKPDEEQHWTTYTIAMLAFSIAGFVSLYLMQRLQAVLPFNPQGLGGGHARTCPSTPRSASSPTPTGSPMAAKPRMAYLVQMLGLTVHNFLSAPPPASPWRWR